MPLPLLMLTLLSPHRCGGGVPGNACSRLVDAVAVAEQSSRPSRGWTPLLLASARCDERSSRRICRPWVGISVLLVNGQCHPHQWWAGGGGVASRQLETCVSASLPQHRQNTTVMGFAISDEHTDAGWNALHISADQGNTSHVQLLLPFLGAEQVHLISLAPTIRWRPLRVCAHGL
jgi:hypothetical protein